MTSFRLGSFASWNEWLYVKRVLLDLSPQERLYELLHCQDVIRMWRTRQHIPHSVDITAEMVDLMMKDPLLSGLPLEQHYPSSSSSSPMPFFFYQDHELILLYSLVIIRAINGITEPNQQSYYVRSILTIAEELGLPGWIVELRHDATHGHLPSLSVLRAACRYLLTWYEKYYWKPQYEELEKLNKKSIQGSFHKEKVEDCSSTWLSDFLVPCLLSSSLAFAQQLTEKTVVVEGVLTTDVHSEVVPGDAVGGVGSSTAAAVSGGSNEVRTSGEGNSNDETTTVSNKKEEEGEEARVEEETIDVEDDEEDEEVIQEMVNEERENVDMDVGVVEDENDKVRSTDLLKIKKKKEKKKKSILNKVRSHIQGWKKRLQSLPQQVLPGALHQLLYGIVEQLVKTSCHLSRLGEDSSIEQQAEVLKLDILIEWLLECERLIRSHASRMILPFLPCLQGLLSDLQSSTQHSTLLMAKIKSITDSLTRVSIRTGSATRISKDHKRPVEKSEEEIAEAEKEVPVMMEEEASASRVELSEDRKTIDEMEAWLNSISSRPSKRAKISNAPVQIQKASAMVMQQNEVKREEHEVTIKELRLGEKKDFVSVCVDYPIWPMGLLPGRSEAPQLHLIQYDTSSQLS